MTDRASLAGNTAAGYVTLDVETTQSVGQLHGLTNDQFQGLQTKVVVDVTTVDLDGAGTVCIYAYTSDRMFSSAGAVEIRFRIVHYFASSRKL